MLFLRDYLALSGGHLKYLDYLRHTREFAGIETELYLTPRSLRDSSNPFLCAGTRLVRDLKPASSYFIAGLDWGLLDAAGIDTAGKPVVNLIQHVAHANPGDPKYRFLSRRALRICVSAQVAEAILATKRVNGEVVVVENGIDIATSKNPMPITARSGIFIGGAKSPTMARALAALLAPALQVDLCDHFVPRAQFLARMARARLCIVLPHPTEGFFLPALEAMALGVPAVVPDCIGNRGFCHDGENCVVPAYEIDAIATAATQLHGDELRLSAFASRGLETSARHSLAREREVYLRILGNYLNPWRG